MSKGLFQAFQHADGLFYRQYHISMLLVSLSPDPPAPEIFHRNQNWVGLATGRLSCRWKVNVTCRSCRCQLMHFCEMEVCNVRPWTKFYWTWTFRRFIYPKTYIGESHPGTPSQLQMVIECKNGLLSGLVFDLLMTSVICVKPSCHP